MATAKGLSNDKSLLERKCISLDKNGKLSENESLSMHMKKKSRDEINSRNRSRPPKSRIRLSREEEIELSPVIKQGARLQRIKTDFESKYKREISRSEWTELAGLENPSSLRRLVSSYRRAKNKLVTANMGLVYSVVRNGGYLSKRGVTEDELVQEGSLGLIRAAELFDPDKGHRFSTYATVWIRGTLGNTKVDQTIVVPSRERNKWNKIQKAIADLSLLKGYYEKPSSAEIAKMVDMSVEEVENLQQKMTQTNKLLSLDYEYEGTTSSGGLNKQVSLYGDKALSSSDDFELINLREDVISAISRILDEREGTIMGLRYGLKDGKSRSIVECAAEVGLSRARVQQIAASSLKKLRDSEDTSSLQKYLLT